MRAVRPARARASRARARRAPPAPSAAAARSASRRPRPEITSARSVSGSSSAPRRLYWPVSRAASPSSWSPQAISAEEAGDGEAAAVAGVERHDEEDRQQRDPQVGDRVRDRPGPQRLALLRLGRRTVGAVDAREPLSGKCAPQLRGGVDGAVQRQRPLLLAAPHLRLDLAGLEPLATDRQAQRRAEQLGVGELRPRASVAVVVEDVEAGLAQLVVEPVGDGARLLARPCRA